PWSDTSFIADRKTMKYRIQPARKGRPYRIQAATGEDLANIVRGFPEGRDGDVDVAEWLERIATATVFAYRFERGDRSKKPCTADQIRTLVPKARFDPERAANALYLVEENAHVDGNSFLHPALEVKLTRLRLSFARLHPVIVRLQMRELAAIAAAAPPE